MVADVGKNLRLPPNGKPVPNPSTGVETGSVDRKFIAIERVVAGGLAANIGRLTRIVSPEVVVAYPAGQIRTGSRMRQQIDDRG